MLPISPIKSPRRRSKCPRWVAVMLGHSPEVKAAFAAAMLGAAAYFARGWAPVATLLPEGHKYEQLLAICVIVLLAGFAAVLAGARRG